LGFFVVIPPLILFSFGYRLDYASGFGLRETGGLYVSSLAGSKIFVNNVEEKNVGFLQTGLFMQGLLPGKYFIFSTKDGYWPWSKNIAVKKEMVAEAKAILVPQNPRGEIVSDKKVFADLTALKKGFKTATTTNAEKQNVYLYTEKNNLRAKWLGDSSSLPYFFCDDNFCKDDILLLKTPAPIKNIGFYPQRKDVAVVALQNEIYALEIDGRGGRTFHPVYKGKEPVFGVGRGESSIYVLDEANLIKISL
jgi:hypothetical protein